MLFPSLGHGDEVSYDCVAFAPSVDDVGANALAPLKEKKVLVPWLLGSRYRLLLAVAIGLAMLLCLYFYKSLKIFPAPSNGSLKVSSAVPHGVQQRDGRKRKIVSGIYPQKFFSLSDKSIAYRKRPEAFFPNTPCHVAFKNLSERAPEVQEESFSDPKIPCDVVPIPEVPSSKPSLKASPGRLAVSPKDEKNSNLKNPLSPDLKNPVPSTKIPQSEASSFEPVFKTQNSYILMRYLAEVSSGLSDKNSQELTLVGPLPPSSSSSEALSDGFSLKDEKCFDSEDERFCSNNLLFDNDTSSIQPEVAIIQDGDVIDQKACRDISGGLIIAKDDFISDDEDVKP